MAKIERTKNTISGAIWGLIEKIFSIILPFAVRTILIKKLGSEYLGLSSLFTSILQVLNLTELGFGAAAIYAMYKPISEDDYNTVGAIVHFLKKIYNYIGIIIIGVGICLVPFLKYLISGSIPSDINIYILYFIYLFNTAISYLLFAHKNSLLIALQLNKITNKIIFFCNSTMYILQIIVLFVYPNYYLYIIFLPVFTIMSSTICSIIVDKKYKQWMNYSTLNNDIKSNIKKKIFPLMSTKLAVVLVNSVDTLVISAFLGLNQVTIYNNYFYIMNSVSGLLIVMYSAMQSGVGNSLVVDSHEKIMKDFNKFCFLNNWIITFCTVCLLCLYQPFMEIWVGKDMMLSFWMVILFCLYFYATMIQRIVVIYKDAAGIWKEDMLRCYFSCTLNFVINIASVKFIGLYGVIGSSVLVSFIAIPWMAYILYKNVFKESSKEFFIREFTNFIKMILISFFTYFLCYFLPNGIIFFLLRILICLIVPNLLIIFCNFRTNEFKKTTIWIKNILRNYKEKKNDQNK